jgi:hypothetical protein
MKEAAAPVTHPLYERLFMRVSFAWVVLISTPRTLNAHSLPEPNGLARLVDLSFLTNPGWLAAAHTVLLIALGFYIMRVLCWLALPVALLVNVAVNTVENSQGAIHHAVQIVSLVLLAQTVAHYYGLWLGRGRARAGFGLEEREISWAQQAVAAAYFIAGLTKLIQTHGAWIFRARFIGVQIFKTAYQEYYNYLDPAGLNQQVAIAQFAAAHGTIIALIAGMGLGLELLAPAVLLGRWWGLVLGCGFIAFHLSISSVMQLSFVFHQLLVLIFIVSPIYWVVQLGRAAAQLVRKRNAIPPAHIPMI